MGKRTCPSSFHNSIALTYAIRPAEKTSNELLFSLLPGLDEHLTIEAYQIERQIAQDAAWPHVELLPGAEKLIRHLHAHQVPMAVATGSTRRNFRLKTAHEHSDPTKIEIFSLFGDYILCGDDPRVKRPKPAPDIFLHAATMIGREVGLAEEGHERGVVSGTEKEERSKGLVFEDGIPGVQAALRAGMQGTLLFSFWKYC